MSTGIAVVGIGPGRSSTTHHLARAGLDVVPLEKSPFPRDRICGNGLTPAAVYKLITMDVDATGWMRDHGLTVIGSGYIARMDWPNRKPLPDCGMAHTRMNFGHTPTRCAAEAGTRLYKGIIIISVIQGGSGRVVGVQTKSGRDKSTTTTSVHASVAIDAGGVAARLVASFSLEGKMNRPMGVAAYTYFHSPRGGEEWVESHLELRNGTPGASDLPPGYGWIFPMGDGIVNIDFGPVASRTGATNPPYCEVFRTWAANLSGGRGFTPENQIGQLRSATPPMSFNHESHYTQGLTLVGDVGGMVSPYNDEGIASAMKTGYYAVLRVAQALSRFHRAGIDRAMRRYPYVFRNEYDDCRQLGRIFAVLIGNPTVVHIRTNVGLPTLRLVTLVHKLLSGGYERIEGDFDDQPITVLTKVVRPV